MKPLFRLSLAACAGVALATAAAATLAQTSVTVDVTQNPPTQYRDERTGTVWAPGVDNRLSRDNRLEPSDQPSTPADKAFDPGSQVAIAEPLVVQRPQATLMGTVPITAGPNVPVVTLDGPTLKAMPGDRWLTVLYVTNNSGVAVDSQVGCTFTNGGRAVQEARVVVPTAGPGQRLGMAVYGPRTEVFVDRVLCRVLTP
ncbi:MAG: hypothetical protein JOY64_16325 [Alphaproteobacteria bacterium]|nr:hypothetical protein [Alphaproteobacteria bacterium]MBV8409198.1 hypothetical protein [Alphaproteobacteria bacterium]